MRGLNNQVWVTAALTDDNVGDALTLCESLKQTFTNRQVVVITSSKVSYPYRVALNHGFDFVFQLEEGFNTAGLELEDFAKLFTFTLKSFDNCAFLPSTMFAVKNGDHIFDLGKQASRMVYIRGEASSIFVLQPNWTCFIGVMNALQARNENTVDSFLTNWSKKQNKVCVIKKNKFTRAISLNPSRVTGNEKNICVIHIMENPNKLIESGHKFGEYDEAVLKQWASVHGMILKSLQASPLLELAVNNETFRNEPIAIVGMSCRFPGANNLEEYWNILFAGEDATSTPPPFRWLREQTKNYKPEFRNTNAGFLKVPVDEFDAKFFGISPKEVLFMDPQHRLMHELVWEGLEDAAINPEGLEGSNTGVFMGSWTNDYSEILSATGNNEFFRTYMGNSIGTLPARISQLLKWTGPAVATESGCSSAMVAVHLACNSLQNEESNVALACGVNLLLHPFDIDQMPMVLSPDGKCKTFDANANGFARAEGCAVLVLKRLSDAVSNGDNIWGLIRGTGMTQEGLSKSLGTPTVHGESLAMIHALNDAGVDPAHVSYVETHGTGTRVGDPLEVAAIAKAYHTEDRVQPLIIGSCKTNVGHTESVSGLAGIMKVILGMQHELIPAHRNFETLNPAIDLNAIPAVIPLKAVEWKKVRGQPRIAGVSSFGITGTDAHAIVQEPPSQQPKANVVLQNSSRPLQILKITTKSAEALDPLLEKYQNMLSTTTYSLEDITHTANISRSNFNHRAIFIGSSPKEMADMIAKGKAISGEVSDTQGKICFLFTGQGSQYPDMGKELYNSSPVFRMHFDYCVNHLKNHFNVNIMDVLWTSNSAEIGRTIYSQTSIFCVEYALLKLWESWGIKPDYALGHSLGEFTAAVCSNILGVDDALKLVAERSRLIDQLPRGKMLVVKASKKTVDGSLSQFAGMDNTKILDCAAINSMDQTVVAGDSEVVEAFAKYCENNKVKCIVLESTHAFHSKHMDPILAEYKEIAASVFKLGGNSCKYISGMKGTEIECDHVDASYWVEHTREKVQFLNASKKAVELGCTLFLEVGPQPVLSALTMMNNSGPITCLPSLKRDSSDWSVILNSVGKMYVKGIPIDWEGMDDFCSRTKVPLPHYPFDGKKCWPDMNGVNEATIHPLLGSPIANPSSTKLFQSLLNLKSLEYIKDHKIDNYIIYPGACYLETIMAAGLATTTADYTSNSISAPNWPMMIENLKIAAPLCLEEGKSCQVQTVADFDSNASDGDRSGLSVSVYHKLGVETDSNKWILHASGSYTPLATTFDQYPSCISGEDLQKILAAPPKEDDYLPNIYAKVASNGLKFGPLFQSFEKVWRSEDNSTLTGKIKYTSGEAESNQYILHPIIIDAIFQGIMFWKHEETIKRKLCVPLAIQKFIWFSKTNLEDSYLHAFEQPQGDTTISSVVLMDSTGKIGAIFSGFEFAETTSKTVEAVLEHQTNSMPELWEERWRGQLGPYQNPVNPHKDRDMSEEEVDHISTTYGQISPELSRTYKLLEQMAYLSMLKSLQECGWKPILNEVIDEEVLFTNLGIMTEFRKYFAFFLHCFQLNGILAPGDKPGQWVVVEKPKGIDEIDAILQTHDMTTFLVNNLRVALLFLKVGESMTRILKGKESPLKVLFPDVKSEVPTMTDFYKEYSISFGIITVASQVFNERLKTMCAARKQQPDGDKSVLRVLEVGAGTGVFTHHALKYLDASEMPYEFTYTDISSAFFADAEATFGRKNMTFRKLNLEEDPLAQGFSPGCFDYVFACEVLHATKDICETLNNIKVLMKPGGKLDFIETTSRNINITFMFGMLEGYWRFEDFELRPNHCTMLSHQWQHVLTNMGFQGINIFSSLGGQHSTLCVSKANDNFISKKDLHKCWLIFSYENEPICKFLTKKISSYGRQSIVVRFATEFRQLSLTEYYIRAEHKQDFEQVLSLVLNSSWSIEGILYGWALNPELTEQNEILQPYFHLLQSLTGLKSCPNVITLIGGYAPMETNDLSQFSSSTLVGLSRVVRNEHINLSCRCVDVSMVDPNDETKLMEVVYELWNSDKNNEIVYVDGERFHRKFQKCKVQGTDLKLPPGTDRFQLVHSNTKAIADLTFGPLPIAVLKENEVEIQVKAWSLNFRDVLCVIKPIELFENQNTIGIDFSGVIKRIGANVTKWCVGDPVYGLNSGGGPLPNHVVAHESSLLAKPSHLTFSEASTLPVVLSTVYHSLIEVANITADDTVLIHTASGGVGLCAIEICKHFGCTIIATAGSKRKQNYLRSIGVQNVFHSRTTAYEQGIMKLTNGEGVNVVLNSLTSEGFKEATLSVCAPGARFVEMSKLSIWTDGQVRDLRPDVSYTIVDLTSMTLSQMAGIYRNMDEFVNKKIVKPIPYVRFGAVNIREALQYLHKAKHIGKVCVTMPELRQEGGKISVYTPMFWDNSSYLITGGLGGIGFEVCKWMVRKGAKNVILGGRNSPKPGTQREIDEMNRNGANVIPVQLDVGNYEECRQLFEQRIITLGLPAIRGIMHAAGTLSDGMLINQNWSKLSSTFSTKIDGTLNLHKLTMSQNLEHFVLFSSVAAMIGSPGQSNHVAGNLFEDTFCYYRRSMGLPATTINWGPWGEVGVATDVVLPYFKPLSNLQGLTALEYCLERQRVQTCVMNVESFQLLTRLLPQLTHYIDERIWKTTSGASHKTLIKTDDFWRQYESASDDNERLDWLKDTIRTLLRITLRMDDSDGIEDNTSFQDLGVDSLMFVEIKNGLQAILGDRVVVDASSVRDCDTVALLSDCLVNLIEGKSENAGPLSEQDVNDLIREDAILPEEITPTPSQTAKPVGDIRTILLTGATGFLGSYILRDLSQMKQITKIVCLIRPKKNGKVDLRLQNALEAKGILDEVDMSKVQCVSGNMAESHLGVDPQTYADWTQNIDAIFNCAAYVNHVERYQKTKSNSGIREVNVGGVKNLLHLACTGQLKHVVHSSALCTLTKVTEDHRLAETWQDIGDFDGVSNLAYPNTKFVQDMLMKEAVKRGIPVKALRYPYISGDSRTGQVNIEENHLILRYIFCMKTNIMPSNPIPVLVVPVDTCSEVSIKLFFNEQAPSDVYNISSDAFVDQEFIEIAKNFGYSVDTVEYSEFAKRIQESNSTDPSIALFREFYKEDTDALNLYFKVDVVRRWVDGDVAQDFWRSQKIAKFVPSFYSVLKSGEEYITKDLLYAKSKGWF